jgi:hypothetical protein
MTTEDDIKTIQEEVKEMKDYPVKLSWKNVWIVVTTSITIIGGAFGFGIKTESGAVQIKINDIKLEYEKKLAVKEDELIELNRKYKEVSEDNIYYMNRYSVIKERLENCQKGNIFSIKSDEDNK